MKSHPLRQEINQEVHARPFQRLSPNLGLVHITVCCDEQEKEALAAALARLLSECQIPAPVSLNHFFYSANDELGIRFEPHNEFYTLTLYQLNQANTEQIIGLWESLPGSILCGLEMIFIEEAQPEPVLDLLYQNHQIAGAHVMGDAAKVWTDFHPQGDTGFVKVMVQNQSLKAYQAGRLLQRLCEIETYRHVALLALPIAKQLMPQLTQMDKTLADITHRIAEKDNTPELLQELMALAAQVEELSAETSHRFSATEAYFAVLDSRISELRETRIRGLQTVEQFMERRLDPARRTCIATSKRIERLSKRITRATELLRSQVDLSVEAQNQELLEALNSRSQRQLRLQAKLESFTIIVVTYYAFDLLERTIRNTVATDALRDNVLMWLSFSVPLIAGVLWWYVRRLLRDYGEE